VTGIRVASGNQVGSFEGAQLIHRCPLEASILAASWPIDLGSVAPANRIHKLPRKEVIQPHLPVRLPCYDFVPITNPTFDGCLLAVGPPASGVIGFHDVTGGVYKAREHIHRSMLTCGY
jgi:hypothetical protein